jgi:hypothetical protein
MARARQWTDPRKERKANGEREPVLDFLFDYYPYSPSKLEQWFPGIETPESSNEHTEFLNKHRRRITFVIELLQGMETRPAIFNCFGLHEWAMVYKAPSDAVRHPDPLRLSDTELAETVDSIGLRCTHIDAFRFFTVQAAPLNSNSLNIVPTRENQTQLDQKGCLHANMDLYKYCMWFQPILPGDLVLDCFELALHTRTLDMQASPYDLSAFGYSPIPIETPEGRAEYVRIQKEISNQATELRERLLQYLRSASHLLDQPDLPVSGSELSQAF